MKTQTFSNRMASRLTSAAVLLALAIAPGFAAKAAQDWSALPNYKPGMEVSGVLRSYGNDQMATLLKSWQKGFKKYHPTVLFQDTLKGSASGMYGLELRTADMALMGRPIGPFERYGIYERSWIFPIEIEVATGAYETPQKSPAVAIFVHKDNPLTKLTVKQLDGIFGAERGGGWIGLSWNEKAARGPEENIRTWGQLGIQGPLADKPIHVYGQPNLGAGYISHFEIRVFGGGRVWNEDLREYQDRAQMIAALSRDPYGIAYAALGNKAAGVKPVALAETSAGPFVELTKDSVASRRYPLTRAAYIYYTIDNEKCELSETRGDPRVKEFLRYILSKQGQQEVVREGVYLPLTPAVAAEQLKKIDSKEFPWERNVLDD